jgi:hypothetical protein
MEVATVLQRCPFFPRAIGTERDSVGVDAASEVPNTRTGIVRRTATRKQPEEEE